MLLGSKSLENLNQCDTRLQEIIHILAEYMDVAVTCGHRNEAAQNAAFIGGNSKLVWPNSKHNKLPSQAIDVVPHPIDWKDIPRFQKMCDLIVQIAEELGYAIRLGRDFPFKDYPHVELIPVKTR